MLKKFMVKLNIFFGRYSSLFVISKSRHDLGSFWKSLIKQFGTVSKAVPIDSISLTDQFKPSYGSVALFLLVF